MSRFLIAAFAFIVLFSVATADTCPDHEVYSTCGTACEPSCEDPNPETCTKQCVIGCFCEAGLLRNSKRKCVTQDKCDCDN